jgi:replicative DNA helicase
MISASSILGDFLKDYEKNQKKPSVKVQTTGLDIMPDKHKLNIVTGLPGTGKTAYLLQTAIETAEKGYSSFVLTYEMSIKAVLERIISNATGYELNHIVEQTVPFEELRRAIEGTARTIVNLFISENTRDEKGIRTEIEELHMNREHSGIFVYVDYLQKSPFFPNITDERTRLNRVLNLFGQLSTDYATPFVVASSMNRNGYDRTGMDIMKETGNIEFDADTISVMKIVNRDKKGEWQVLKDDELYEERKQNPVAVKLHTFKNRHGQESSKILSFDKSTQCFTPWTDNDRTEVR